MNLAVWQPGTIISGPVYIDANILVGAQVNSHRLYVNSAAVLGDLLANQHRILLSPVVFSEAQWSVIKISYYESMNLPPRPHFTKDMYRKWHSKIFHAYGPRLQAIGSWFKGLLAAKFPIDVVPDSASGWSAVMDLTYTYMDQFALTPADAIHLALAATYAKTFITADSDFSRMSALPSGNLVVLTVPP